MTTREIKQYLTDARRHLDALESMGANSRCESGCPCERAREVYAAAVESEDIQVFDLSRHIEDLYPEVMAA